MQIGRSRSRLLVPALVALVASAVIGTQSAIPLERLAGDALLRLSVSWSRPGPADDLVIVAIDPASLRRHPDWPWPRSRHAALLDRLAAAGAHVVAFDVGFQTARDPGDDARLADSLRAYGHGVLAAVHQTQSLPGGVTVETLELPTPPLASAAAAVGTTTVPIDSDGIVRRATRAPDVAGARRLSFSEAVVRVAHGEPTSSGAADWPTGTFAVDYRRSVPEPPVLSFADVLEGEFAEDDVRGRIVLVGATAIELQDRWNTPLGPAWPGVMVQALAVRTLSAERAARTQLRSAGLGERIALAVLLSFLAFALSTLPHAVRPWSLAGLGLLVAALPLALLARTGWLHEPVVPLGVVASHYVLGLEVLRRRLRRRSERRESSISALSRLGTQVAESEDDVLDQALASLVDLVGARMATARIDSGASGEGRLQLWPPGAAVELPGADALRARAAEEARVCTGTSHAPDASALELACVPLVAGVRPVGSLLIAREGASGFDEVELRTLAALAGMLALQIDRGRIIRSLRGALDRAEQANRAKTSFLANMSHELRTPLNSIIGQTESAIWDLEHGEQTFEGLGECLEVVRRNGEHLLELVTDVLDAATLESGQLRVERAPMNPRELVDQSLRALASEARAKGLSFQLSCEPTLPALVLCDRLRLRQVLINLVGNALKFTERGGLEVEIGYVPAESRLELRVRDSGPGIPPDQLDRIFEPFAQSDESTQRVHGGTGLGLAITRQIARLLDGDCRATSRIGQGSTFAFSCIAEPAPLPAQTDAPRPLAARILVAEDGPDNQRLIGALLRKWGAEVEIVENGALALERLAIADFDAVLMDMSMPVMDGYEATRELRRQGFELPVIALTAHALAGDRACCLDAGCDDYLTKPVRREALLAAIHAALEKRGD